jgi:hypothetical protein
MIRKFAAASLLFALSTFVASATCSQDPATTSAPTPTSPPSSSSPTPNPTKPKPKKVWTNDNVPEAGPGISIVGSNSSGNSKTQPKATHPATKGSIDPRIVASLRDQLNRLQGQLSIVDRLYSDLKAQSKGESRNAGGLQQNTAVYDSSSVEEQLQHLQEKKKRIQASIDELLDAARKAGIEPGDLR